MSGRSALRSVVLVLGSAGCALPHPTETARPALRELAAGRHLEIGVAVSARALHDDRLFRQWLAREFSLVTTENALKFGPLHPARNRYDFRDADAIVAFAERHRMRIRGHTLVWKRQLPEWLTHEAFTREELLAILREHILRVVGRYRGRIYAWDVVNEALRNVVPEGAVLDEAMRPTLWLRGIGPEYIELAFRWAHEADPEALLFYNEAGAEALGAKSDAAYALVRRLLERGVPLHGVGLQMHLAAKAPPDTALVAANMRRLAALGLEIQVTEMDVTLAGAAGTPAEQLATQATIYREVLRTCLSVPRCTAFVMWGMTDRYTWRYPDTPLVLDRSYQPKPAFEALQAELSTPAPAAP
ncbi:MAG TPA: endo-1,4-beta-xylanase [Gemmatimonadales bacterium]